MMCVRGFWLLVPLLTTVVWGQKVEKDGLDTDHYNLDRVDKLPLKDTPKKNDPKQIQYIVTEEVFFDIVIKNRTEKEQPRYGRIQIACFGDITPITCLNFVALAKGTWKGRKKLFYRGTPVHRIIKDFVIQMGDVTGKRGKGGTSIYGETFHDENFLLSHRGPGWVSMANHGRDTNGSQFFILVQPARWLNNKHVVFGKVIKGMDFVRQLSELDTYVTGEPKNEVVVTDCGAIGVVSKYEMTLNDVMSENDILS